ncbi:hypothetical protein PTI98_013634 [Pleurotus ostreatus]|nr:hypothetical protein PTI98_013634 [Pleurotus ostreatus]
MLIKVKTLTGKEVSILSMTNWNISDYRASVHIRLNLTSILRIRSQESRRKLKSNRVSRHHNSGLFLEGGKCRTIRRPETSILWQDRYCIWSSRCAADDNSFDYPPRMQSIALLCIPQILPCITIEFLNLH